MSLDIKTYVLLDVETTGLMKENPKITELSLIAVQSDDLPGKVFFGFDIK